MSITEVEIIRQIVKGTATADNIKNLLHKDKDQVSRRSSQFDQDTTASIVSQGKGTKNMAMRLDHDYKLHGHPEHHPMQTFAKGKIGTEGYDSNKKI